MLKFLIITFIKSISMSGFLFHETVFGPVMSRRLGVSLVNVAGPIRSLREGEACRAGRR